MPPVDLHTILRHHGNAFTLLHTRQLVVVLPEIQQRGLLCFHIHIYRPNARTRFVFRAQLRVSFVHSGHSIEREQSDKTVALKIGVRRERR